MLVTNRISHFRHPTFVVDILQSRGTFKRAWTCLIRRITVFDMLINVECLRYAKEMQIIWEKVINENKKDTLQDKQKRGLKRVRDDNTDTENLSTEHWTNFRAKQGKFSI
ncbi:unnamed protein product [Rhizophagus irregularis]|nr:unnamed protein product [Rhizophagus irregularis]